MSVRFGQAPGGAKRVLRAEAAALIAASAVAAPLFLCLAAKAETAGDVLKKMVGTYSSASAYTATIISHTTGKTPKGEAFTLTKSQVIKYKAPNLISVIVTFNGTGAAAGKVEAGNQTVVADGKTLTAYSPTRKGYVKKPDLPKLTVLDLLDVLKKIPTTNQSNVKMKTSSSVNGRAVNVVEVSPQMPGNLTIEQQKAWKQRTAGASPLDLYIDKQTSALLRITSATKDAAINVSLDNQLFNSSIPASAFNYTPPAGSKEITAPPAGAPLGNGAAGQRMPLPGAGAPPPPHK